jgi:CubicO group peptidase (beta-lactamase class C family)
VNRAKAAGEWIADALPDLIRRHGAPGAQLSVLANGEIVDTAAGVLNVATGVPVTTDSVFQIGSVTKVLTATLVLQLVRKGLVDLDQPVRDHLTDFALADDRAAKAVTVRQLLCHTGGFEGDLFTDTGNNPDAIEKYVALLRTAPQSFQPGSLFSYCNSGYVVLGRLVEVLRGEVFHDVLRERIIRPLELKHIATCADEAILLSTAVGHTRSARGTAEPVQTWAMPASTAPSGAMLAMSARDLLRFVGMHLTSSEYNVMREPQIEVPPLGTQSGHWGLGWALPDYGGHVVLAHGGRTYGQRSLLRVVPAAGVAVALLTNGGDIYALYEEVFGHLLSELAGITQPSLPVPPADPLPVNAHRITGTYRTSQADMIVRVGSDGRAWISERVNGTETGPPTEVVRLDDDTLIMVEPREGKHSVIRLGDDAHDGRTRYLHTGRVIMRAD